MKIEKKWRGQVTQGRSLVTRVGSAALIASLLLTQKCGLGLGGDIDWRREPGRLYGRAQKTFRRADEGERKNGLLSVVRKRSSLSFLPA